MYLMRYSTNDLRDYGMTEENWNLSISFRFPTIAMSSTVCKRFHVMRGKVHLRTDINQVLLWIAMAGKLDFPDK
jgi:hypothetical protein